MALQITTAVYANTSRSKVHALITCCPSSLFALNPIFPKALSTRRNLWRAWLLPSEQEGLNGPSILCDPCKGKGWVNCDFCNGQKINVQAQINRFYWRCPSCRADILTAWRIDNFCREDGFLLGQKKGLFKEK